MLENNLSNELGIADEELASTLAQVHVLLSRHKRSEDQISRDESGTVDQSEIVGHKQHLVDLKLLLERQDAWEIARILEALPETDRLIVWGEVAEGRRDNVLELLDEEIREWIIVDGHLRSNRVMVNAFELKKGRLSQVTVTTASDLRNLKPIWVDLVAPSPEVRQWVGHFFRLELPNPDSLTDLEASARFYVEENGEVHLHSDFLLDADDESRNVPVAFILHSDILFSVRSEELPVFRLQRLRARSQPGYVNDGKDVLLDLYAADAEYSADALEDVYAALERAGRQVLNRRLTDDQAALILAEIAREEDLNGRIRRNVLDTRRALSFLMRGKFLMLSQQEDSRQILRDIESLDHHTSFLFGKINFLMDAVVGFININQNQRVSKLTKLSIVFMPINIVAGIGGMSEFSMMTGGIPWPLAYGAFTVGMGIVGYITYLVLRHSEQREAERLTRETVKLTSARSA